MTLFSAAAFADVLATNPGWIAALLFLVVFVEALIVIGYLVPAATVLFSVGALAATGVVSLPLAVAGTVTGAMTGGAVNYWLGSRLEERMERLWPFRHHPALLERNRAFVARHGGKSVFLARFSKPFRPTVSAVAGALGMDGRRFALFNFWGALAWTACYLGVGYLLGVSVDFSPAQAVRLSFGLLAITTVAMVVMLLVQRRRGTGPDSDSTDPG